MGKVRCVWLVVRAWVRCLPRGLHNLNPNTVVWYPRGLITVLSSLLT